MIFYSVSEHCVQYRYVHMYDQIFVVLLGIDKAGHCAHHTVRVSHTDRLGEGKPKRGPSATDHRWLT